MDLSAFEELLTERQAGEDEIVTVIVLRRPPGSCDLPDELADAWGDLFDIILDTFDPDDIQIVNSRISAGVQVTPPTVISF